MSTTKKPSLNSKKTANKTENTSSSHRLGDVSSNAELQALEPRILLDAAGFTTAVEAADAVQADETNALAFDYVLIDSDGATATATSSITVTPDNDPPVVNLDLDNSEGGVDDGGFENTYSEGDALTPFVDVDASVTDIDSTLIQTMEIAVTGVTNVTEANAEQLSIGGLTFNLETSSIQSVR